MAARSSAPFGIAVGAVAPLCSANTRQGLGSLKALEETPPTIALLTVDGVERSHLRLLLRRAVSAFPESRIIACDWIGHSGEDQQFREKAVPDSIVRCASVAALTQTLRFSTPSQMGTTLAAAG